jgi:hypothetical protein
MPSQFIREEYEKLLFDKDGVQYAFIPDNLRGLPIVQRSDGVFFKLSRRTILVLRWTLPSEEDLSQIFDLNPSEVEGDASVVFAEFHF